VFTIRKRSVNQNPGSYFERERVTELSREELNYAYKNRSPAGYNDYDIGGYQSMGRSIYTKRIVVKAVESREINTIRSISKHFFLTSGIYGRACRYLAHLPTFDYLVTPYIENDELTDKKRFMGDFKRALKFLESMNLKTRLQDISLKVVVEGVYYGYLRTSNGIGVIQDLPTGFCRSLYKINGRPAVQFNVRYFDIQYKDHDTRMLVLKSMPEELVQGYLAFKNGDLKMGKDMGVWVDLAPERTLRFLINDDETPIFANALSQIIDFDDLTAIDKKKAEQQLLKIMVQKIPLDKNGDFIFDMEEAKAMHSNAVRMLARAMNVDVMTTFADATLLDMQTREWAADKDKEWQKLVFQDLGISQQLFATDGNLALEKSVANDESIIMYLVTQVQDWINFQLEIRFEDRKFDYAFKSWFPRITQHNRIEIAGSYKEQAMLGFSKQLPAIALGQSQANLLATISFENDILKLGSMLEPIKMSSTMSSKDGSGGSKVGRPEKPDDKKSEKTLANEASEG
jgi:hypothetical protein